MFFFPQKHELYGKTKGVAISGEYICIAIMANCGKSSRNRALTGLKIDAIAVIWYMHIVHVLDFERKRKV